MINPMWQEKGFQRSVRVALEPVTVWLAGGWPVMAFLGNKSSAERGCSAVPPALCWNRGGTEDWRVNLFRV